MRRGLWIVALWAAGCVGPQLDNHGPITTGGEPHDMAVGAHAPKTPPDTTSGPTASGCNGVTATGRCEISDKGQAAVVCDVAGNQLQRFDCSAMQKACVIDSTRGATCATLPPPPATTPKDMATTPPAPKDMATASTDMATSSPRDMATAPRDMATAPRDMTTAPPMCISGVDYRGYCASATGTGTLDTAIWCDPATGQTYVVSCAARGQTCQVDGCADGAYCCDSAVSVDMAQPPAMNAECDQLGYAGACSSDGHARWCSAGQLFDIDCGGRGQSCAIDACASGAYCCDDMPPPPPANSECDTLGYAGACTSDGHARWCSGGQIFDIDCGASGQTCEVDTCATGAYCCTS